MPHKATPLVVQGTLYDVGPHLLRQLSSETDGGSVRDLGWETDGSELSEGYHVASCPFGGPIALAAKQGNLDNVVKLYTSMGVPLQKPNDGTEGSSENNYYGSDRSSGYEGRGIVIHLGRSFCDDGSSSTIVYMCWNIDQDHLLVCLSSGSVHAFTSTGDEAVRDSVRVPDAFLYQSIDRGVAIITQRNTAALVTYDDEKDRYSYKEVDIGLKKGQEVVSFAAIPRNRKATSDNDGIDELVIAAATDDRFSTSPIFIARFFSSYGSLPKCGPLDMRSIPNFPKGNIVSFAVSPTKPRIAMIMEGFRENEDDYDEPVKSLVYACSSDFGCIHEIGNTQTSVIPSQLFWIGDDIVGYILLSSQFDAEDEYRTSILAMPYPGDEYSDEGPPANDEVGSIVEVEIGNLPSDASVIMEIDSIRILSTDTFQIIQLVPESIRNTFPVIGSGINTTASTLVCAYDEYASESTACVDFIGELTQKASELGDAIDQLVEFAGYEFDVDVQKRLLRVASFGKSFSNTYVTDNFVNMCRRLKVLQYLRSIGTLISLEQLAVIEETRLTRRLATHGHYQMAFEIAEILNSSVTPLLGIWARHLVSSIPKASPSTSAHERSTYFEIVTDMILNKFELHHYRGVMPYEPVAVFAHRIGEQTRDQNYTDLALRLLAATPSADTRFRVLLTWNQPKEALKEAVASGSSDMIFTVMEHLLAAKDFEFNSDKAAGAITILNQYPESAAILRSFIRCVTEAHTQRNVVKVYSDSFREFTTQCRLNEYFRFEAKLRKDIKAGAVISQIERSVTNLSDGAKAVEEATRNERGGASNTKMMNYHHILLDKQSDLEHRLDDKRFLNASLADTIRYCYHHNRASDAAELVQLFSVNEKMHTWAKLRAYIDSKNWDAINQMASAKKSPIGFDAFVTLLLDANQPEQASRYIPKLSPIEKRMELYVACGDWRGACEDCLRNKEEGLLAQLKSRAKTESAIQTIDSYIQKANR